MRDLQAKRRADERTRTADLVYLRVIHQALQGVARACKSCRKIKTSVFVSGALSAARQQ